MFMLPGAKSRSHTGFQSDVDTDSDSDRILVSDRFHQLRVGSQRTLCLPGRNCPIMNALSRIKARTSFVVSAINASA
jgi:hypothetical protein